MGKTIMGAVVSLDGFMADDNDGVGPMFDWLGNGDVTWSFPGSRDEVRSTQASADFMLSQYRDMAVVVIGRRVFDLTNGWNGVPAAGEHVFVVTHQPPADWEHAGTAPFTFVDGVEKAITAAKEFAGDRDVDVAAGQIGGQALKLGLIDQVVVNLVPVVFGSGRPFFATGGLAEPLRLENPTTIVRGDRSPTWSTTSAAETRPFRACEDLRVMLREFDAQLQKGDNPGAWTCVVLPDAAALFGTRGLVKIRGAIDGEPFDGALMAQGDGSHRLPVKAKLRKAIGKEAGDTVHVRIDERIG